MATINKPTILIVDDEHAIREMISMSLENDYHCLEASDAHKAEALLNQQLPDLILLDWMMPGISGIQYIKSLRRNEPTNAIPVIMLTAKTEEENMLEGLDSGADDYLSKPFSTEELKARIRALLRRTSNTRTNEVLNVANLMLDNTSHRVSSNGEIVTLGPTEYNLLAFFMRSPERVYSREQLLNGVWGESVYVEERTVDVHIRRLRKALEPSNNQNLIQTVRGAGYRLSTQ
ncbi:Phosphate regulon transcriptional regulatory protein PhoB (SphR) [hydrothermal vent metagenome]|uniref:Phosphate regulon transcriptional regulatory protein PhoB n=1 Tax=hydrothermal vent metagenome TaxID=652676 RepID=A0A3B0ZUU9_9ZZZZ